MNPKQINPKDLASSAANTWCPGCGNFSILGAMRAVLAELDGEGYPLEDVVLVSGIGCHAKIVDYLNVNSFYSIHGRTIPVATAIKIANPDLKVICFSGDGDSLAEGLEHLIFAAKRNIDITLILHDNRVYGLTTGQYTPTSPSGFRGRSTPSGAVEPPLNPLELMLSSGATYIARGYSHGIEQLQRLFKEAILHKGFSFVDVLQVCVSYHNLYESYNQWTYVVEDNDRSSFEQAEKIIRSWNYNRSDVPIPLGSFYQIDAPRFDQSFSSYRPGREERESKIKEILENFI
ncbi:MAG TPA: thiamine pyrophosphate-dependent enzyme [Methanothrix sp.]|jgi:2-oxoglutarate ferredoxin oxidoreductase subunit beta|nr:thiamine pyrophosphate-dependent enzyme [Methanothrix sp.]HNU40478.1 thiamine pyrophosphate-dependent enzyme [Methanothrix sp.]HPA97282.1 thiamine pyrophosphate-dependent enzyme [Methanothrix sp.]